MIVDSSALLAVIQGEPEARECAELMLAEACRMSVANWVEAGIVVDNRSIDTQRELDELLMLTETTIEPVTAEQGRVARDAYRRYGRGSGYPARLNYGDCFAYALAVTTGEALLFTGADFSETDVRFARRI
ncbi:type II toxin-antitoxin system VapC family toxin [Paramicrobacterium fandaimingii]|uniref:type II toxin-antitoxin system VapC family toxin n=1 Tax=Paramicrobacterium fandaimingii TaxID=2708079 RepID=UPI0014238320|nr:type II toxin-antitoxin system VapC family toxin [Microbacterium fandaimingii]